MAEAIASVDFVGVQEALESDGVCASYTSGMSMHPLFKTHRDVIIVKKAVLPLKKYDVALYKLGEKFVLHRVIGFDKKSGAYIIRGDNTFVKEYVAPERIIATLAAFRRKSKYKTVQNFSYKLYSRVWCAIYPLRFVFRKIRIFLRRVKGKIVRTLRGTGKK